MSKFKTIKKKKKKKKKKLNDRQLEQLFKMQESFDNNLKLKLTGKRGSNGK